VSGGSVTLSGNTGSHVLSVSEMPPHTHNTRHSPGPANPSLPALRETTHDTIASTVDTTYTIAAVNDSTGGGAGHVHPLSGSHSLSGATVPINVQFVDTIIATKD